MSLRDCKAKLAQRLLSTLRTLHPGLASPLNTRAMARYGVKFPDLLLEKPVEALSLLRESFPYTTPTALRSVLRSILQPVIQDPVKLEYVVRELFQGNPEPFLEAVREVCRRLQ